MTVLKVVEFKIMRGCTRGSERETTGEFWSSAGQFLGKRALRTPRRRETFWELFSVQTGFSSIVFVEDFTLRIVLPHWLAMYQKS